MDSGFGGGRARSRRGDRRQAGEVGKLLAALLDPLAFLHESASHGAGAVEDAAWQALRIKADPVGSDEGREQ